MEEEKIAKPEVPKITRSMSISNLEVLKIKERIKAQQLTRMQSSPIQDNFSHSIRFLLADREETIRQIEKDDKSTVTFANLQKKLTKKIEQSDKLQQGLFDRAFKLESKYNRQHALKHGFIPRENMRKYEAKSSFSQ